MVFRLFNTVGPRQTGRYGMVIPNFVKQALLRPSASPCSATAPRAAASPTSPTWWTRSSSWPTTRTRWARCSTSATTARRSRILRPGRAREGAHGLAQRDRDDRRTTRPTRKASRTCPAACPTSAKLEPPDRLRAQGPPRRDPRQRHRVLPFGQGEDLALPDASCRTCASWRATRPCTARRTCSRASSTSRSFPSTPPTSPPPTTGTTPCS